MACLVDARLLTDAEFLDELGIALRIGGAEVSEQGTPLADEDEKGPTGTRVLLVRFEVGGEVFDPFGEKGDLDFGGTGVLVVFAELLDDVGGRFFGQSHGVFLLSLILS